MSSKPPDTLSSDAPGDEPAILPDAGSDTSTDSGPDSASAAKHHDALFKSLFSDPVQAAAQLQAILPPRVARHIDWTQHPDATHLPAILPIVLYHGSRPWDAPTSLTMLTYGQKLEQQGFDKGVEKGQRTTLLRQLTQRFGTLPESVVEQVAAATSADIERWLDRILDAPSLDTIFARP